MRIRHLLVAILSWWCLYEIIDDLWRVENNYELILGSVVAILPFLLALFLLSLFGYQKDSGWHKWIDVAGFGISGITVAAVVFLIIRNT